MARALEHAWFRPPHGNGPDSAGRELLDRARADWALVTGQGASRRVRVYRWGNTGPAVLLAHGWGGHAAQWQPLVAPLLAAGMRVIAFDALSHGGSDAGARGASQTSVVEMSHSLLATAWHAGPIHAVIAHSLGSAALALAVREGLPATQWGENSEALFLTSSFNHPNAATAAARFANEEEAFVYSRFTNPTTMMFERRLAALEGTEAAIATASGTKSDSSGVANASRI